MQRLMRLRKSTESRRDVVYKLHSSPCWPKPERTVASGAANINNELEQHNRTSWNCTENKNEFTDCKTSEPISHRSCNSFYI